MKKKNHIKVRFSTILLCIPAILLCTAPCGGALFGIDYDDGDVHYVTVDEINLARAEAEAGWEQNGVLDWLHVGADTTVNLYADVSQYIYAYPGSVLNIYSGNIGLYIIVWPGAKVTVYGTKFAVDGKDVDGADEFTPLSEGSVLTGLYGGDSGPILPGLFKPGLWFTNSIPIYLKEAVVFEVEIDIKPGGDDNNINLKSWGVVPVAVLTTNDFDASFIDPTTVEFAGAEEPVRWKLEDVDGDGDLDMLFHFKTEDLLKDEDNPKGLDEGSTKATLTATLIGTMPSIMKGETTTAGEAIQGTDEVCIKSGKKKK